MKRVITDNCQYTEFLKIASKVKNLPNAKVNPQKTMEK